MSVCHGPGVLGKILLNASHKTDCPSHVGLYDISYDDYHDYYDYYNLYNSNYWTYFNTTNNAFV